MNEMVLAYSHKSRYRHMKLDSRYTMYNVTLVLLQVRRYIWIYQFTHILLLTLLLDVNGIDTNMLFFSSYIFMGNYNSNELKALLVFYPY